MIIFFLLIVLGVGGYFLYDKVYLNYTSDIQLKLVGKKNITINYGELEYKDEGAKAKFRDNNLTNKIKVDNKVDYKKVGEHKIVYTVTLDKYDKKKSIERIINIVDKEPPVVTLKGTTEIVLTVGSEYVEPGYTVLDNYDGDITDKVVVTNNINNQAIGTYEVNYKVIDSSNNEVVIKRVVKYEAKKANVKPLPSASAKAVSIPVLNYHFFYDENSSDYRGDGNYLSTKKFEEQLAFLKNNGYKTLTIEEFRAWMYGEIDLPARSVLITIDDGGNGTGLSNGNRMIPLLEKYEANATLFLISAWWLKSNYPSKYLDIESHTYEMHYESYCSGVYRGAKMLCLGDAEVLEDLRLSTVATGTNTAFAYPFYAYNDRTVGLVQQAGFKLAFIGGGVKATRNTNKFKIPRYHIYKTTTIEQFANMVS